MISGNTFYILEAITLGIIFLSTLTSDIGRQFSRKVRSLPFFSIRVMTTCFCEQDFSRFSKQSFAHLINLSLINGQNFCRMCLLILIYSRKVKTNTKMNKQTNKYITKLINKKLKMSHSHRLLAIKPEESLLGQCIIQFQQYSCQSQRNPY